MITAILQFSLPNPISLEEAARAFESTASKYQGLRGLVRKYYLRSEDGRRAGGVYLWETRAAAEGLQRRMEGASETALRLGARD